MLHLPIANADVSGWALLFIGFFVGVLGGFFGIGGAFIVTPALNIFGFPMAFAIGTDIAHIFGKSIVATFKHSLLRHVDFKLGLIMGLLGMYGVSVGKQSILYLEKLGQAGPIVRMIYIFLLFALGFFMIREYYFYTRLNERQQLEAEAARSQLSKWIRKIRVGPFISFPTSNVSAISIWVIVFLSVTTGFLSGFLGVGGGFVRVPVLIYFLGLPTVMAVGTDLFAILITNSWGAYIYALAGKVEIIGAMVMVIGAAVGAQIGSVATAYIKGMKIRLYFGITLILSGTAVFFKQLLLPVLAVYLMLSTAAILSGIIIFMLVKEVRQQNKVAKGQQKVVGPEP
ncbi:sulfite exporter TauE/SafE family protein [Desulfotomaculum sp. 1211_IL3151]|uniref:sulfite exporter TauE/SafE family protein n=1 Tax=Desulfotomaculum sp. 1211_IL3151 TaxID=3084055 RepID=UPI002FD95F7D